MKGCIFAITIWMVICLGVHTIVWLACEEPYSWLFWVAYPFTVFVITFFAGLLCGGLDA